MKRLCKFGFLMLLVGGSLSINGHPLDDTIEDVVKSIDSIKIDENMYEQAFQKYCGACKLGVALIKSSIRIGISDKNILKSLKVLCKTLHIVTPDICESAVDLFGEPVMKIARNVKMSSAEICSFSFACGEVENPIHKWNVSLPSIPKPDKKPVEWPNERAPKLKVLHLADTHYDPLYLEGSNANCAEPLCCRKFDNQMSNASSTISFEAAGKWGSYKCDVPKSTLENLLDHISQTHKDIDYVIWTGDLVPHDIWNQTNEKIMEIIEEHVKLISDKLPGVTIYPSLGNHERAPVDFFPSPEQDSTILELYNDLDTLWSRWLPVNTSSTLRNGAYYSTLVRPGFRIISLNMNVCNNINMWLLLNSTDQLMELKWLINELQSAENAHEKVHIIGHIPPGYAACIKTWSHNYYEIISRYENTVMAQFFAHTHHDEFEVFYDPKNLSRATNIAYIGPSVTPWTNLNPAYRIYYVDGDHKDTTRFVVDHETWSMNLKEANEIGEPDWQKLYTAKDAYSLRSLRPSDWSDFIIRMRDNDDLFDTYYRNYWRNSPMRQPCSSTCKEEVLCQARSGRSRDSSNLCQDLKPNYDKIEDLPAFQAVTDYSLAENGQITHSLHRALTVFFVCFIYVTVI